MICTGVIQIIEGFEKSFKGIRVVEALVNMYMSPRPALIEGRKSADALEGYRWKWQLLIVLCELGLFKYEQYYPWTEPVAVWRSGSITPTEILIIEFYESKIVRFKITDPI